MGYAIVIFIAITALVFEIYLADKESE